MAADLLVNVSSDSAIDSRQFSRQARRISQTRAAELQKPLARTSDIRGTFLADHRGRIVSELDHAAYGVLQARVVPRSGLTPYARWGDWLALLVATLCIGLAALASLPRRGESACQAGACPPLPYGGRRRPRVHAQAGQVLPLSILLVLVIAAMFYLMVNAGQTIIEKMRVTNAADAAAYSTAVVEARALNHDAYLNRAMVANEIAIAQLVSFASWTDYIANAIDNYGRNAPELNFFLGDDPQFRRLDALLGGSDFAARYFQTSAREFADLIISGIGPFITAHDASIHLLSAAQEAVHVQLLLGARQRQIANDIVQAMDPSLQAEIVPVTHTFDDFTRRYARRGRSGDERERLADVVIRSRDAFTRERNWTIAQPSLLGVRKDPALKRRAGTELVGLDEWRAVDTLELHGERFGCGKLGTSWCGDVRQPIGWGAISVGSGGGDARAGQHGNAHAENPRTAREAESGMVSPPRATFHGIPDSWGLADLDPAREITTGITVRVSKAHARTLTSGNAARVQPSGRLALFDNPHAAGQIEALARAQIFFDRIANRVDGKHEVGSLFNPYWRVRLVATTAADKAYAATRQAGLSVP